LGILRTNSKLISDARRRTIWGRGCIWVAGVIDGRKEGRKEAEEKISIETKQNVGEVND